MIRLGFEPKTHSLEGCCSIQLSYRTNPWLLVGQVVLLVPKVAAKIDIIFVFAISGCCKSWVLVDFNWVWIVFWLGFEPKIRSLEGCWLWEEVFEEGDETFVGWEPLYCSEGVFIEPCGCGVFVKLECSAFQ